MPAAARRGLALTRYKFVRALGGANPVPDVDLLVRTGGERRRRDFLLWECADAAHVFLDTIWPDFDADALRAAVAEFHCHDRRLGGLGTRAPARVSTCEDVQ